MDKKIELEAITDTMFQEMLDAVNAEILVVAKEAQAKINELLSRFAVKCDISLSYKLLNPPSAEKEKVKPVRRSRKKKTA